MIVNYKQLRGYQLLHKNDKRVFNFLVSRFNENKQYSKHEDYVITNTNQQLCEALGGMNISTFKGALGRIEKAGLIVRPYFSPQPNEKMKYSDSHPWITKDRMIKPHATVLMFVNREVKDGLIDSNVS